MWNLPTSLRPVPYILPLAVLICLGAVARAESPAAEYVEYRSSPALGRISVSDCFVRGERSVAYLQEHAEDLAARGIYVCLDEEDPYLHHRRETVGGRKIDTFIVFLPPAGDASGGEGEEAAYATQQLIVCVNGRRKIHCTIGTSADGELWVSEVNLFPEDGTIEVRALTANGEEVVLPEQWQSMDDPHVITDDSFYEDAPEWDPNPVIRV